MAEQEDDVQVVGSSPKKRKKKGSPPQYGGPKTNAAAAAGMRPEDAASLGRAPSPRSEAVGDDGASGSRQRQTVLHRVAWEALRVQALC